MNIIERQLQVQKCILEKLKELGGTKAAQQQATMDKLDEIKQAILDTKTEVTNLGPKVDAIAPTVNAKLDEAIAAINAVGVTATEVLYSLRTVNTKLDEVKTLLGTISADVKTIINKLDEIKANQQALKTLLQTEFD